MSGDWWVQQGLSRAQFEGWAILCDEGHAQEVHLLKSEIEHHLERETNKLHAQSPLHRQNEPLFLNSQFRLFRLGLLSRG